MSKYKTRPRVVEGVRIVDEGLAGPEGVGSWMVLDGDKQSVVANEDFLKKYTAAGRGTSKTEYEKAKKDAGIVDPPAKKPKAAT